METQATLERRANREHQACQVTRANKAFLVPRGRPDPQDQQDLKENRVSQDSLASQDSRDHQALQEKQDRQGHQDQKRTGGRRAFQDLRDQRGPQAARGPQACRDPQVLKAVTERMGSLEYRDCLVLLVLLAPEESRVSKDTKDIMGSLDQRETVAPRAPPEQQENQEWRVIQVPQDLRVFQVPPAILGQPDPPDHPDQVALQEWE